MPAPAAMAPRVHKMADPSMPTDPEAMPRAVLHLCDWRGRGGTPAATSASSMSAACDPATGTPMSATSTSPLQTAPLPCKSPGL